MLQVISPTLKSNLQQIPNLLNSINEFILVHCQYIYWSILKYEVYEMSESS